MKSESSVELKTLYNGTTNAVSALKALGRPVDGYGDLLVYLTVQKLDKQSRREWESSMGAKKDPPTFKELQSFVEARICAIQELEPLNSATSLSSKASSSYSIPSKTLSKAFPKVKSHKASGKPIRSQNCSFCHQDHFIVFCDKFRSKSLEDRKAFVKKNKLCLNCLGRHFVRECKSSKVCKVCNAKHHTLIHGSTPRKSNTQSTSVTEPSRTAGDQVPSLVAHQTRCHTHGSATKILLATAVVHAFTASGKPTLIRALLDQGSEASFISELLAQRLKIPRKSASVSISGIGAQSSISSRGRVNLCIGSRIDSRFELTVDALVLPRLTAYALPQLVTSVDWPHLEGLVLADPDFTSNLRIDLLLGADVYSQLLRPGLQNGPLGAPVAQNTNLGWKLTGRVLTSDATNTPCFAHQISCDNSLNTALQRFWEQEEIVTSASLTRHGHPHSSLPKRSPSVVRLYCDARLDSKSSCSLENLRCEPSVRNPTNSSGRAVGSCQIAAESRGLRIPGVACLRAAEPRPLVDRPPWLFLPRDSWPSQSPSKIAKPPDQRVTSLAVAKEVSELWDLLTRYSNLVRLQRIVAWCRRFIQNSRLSSEQNKEERQTAPTLLPSELSESLSRIIRLEQERLFYREVQELASKINITRGPLLKLNPFLTKEGLLRVGGRLKHSILDRDERHPIIVPQASPLTSLLIDRAHRQTMHKGTQLTLATLRQQYWLISGRSSVKTLIGRCIRFLRFRAARATQLMGDLPRERVTPSRPFYHSGVDYAGPIYLRTSKGRGHKSTKAFIAVFVCFATKAVHLKAVSDYITNAFLAAYKRFVSRRRLCRTISSDCGTNFVGADIELRSLFNAASVQSKTIAAALANDGVEWRFNPPSAPHFGGLWEAAVKSVKHHLRRVISDTTLTFEEMATLFTQIEACLNSRPIQALTDDPEDHFLIRAPLSAVPEPPLKQLPVSRLSRWQMRDSFWGCWASEYLHQLQERPKWRNPQLSLQIGDLVLVVNELHAPTRWPLARIIATHVGENGHVRVATVKTATLVLKKPVVKLCLLARNDDI